MSSNENMEKEEEMNKTNPSPPSEQPEEEEVIEVAPDEDDAAEAVLESKKKFSFINILVFCIVVPAGYLSLVHRLLRSSGPALSGWYSLAWNRHYSGSDPPL